jgi:hypothetical protein
LKEMRFGACIIVCSACVASFSSAIDKTLECATIELLKTPVLTARHGGVLFFKMR